MIIKNNKYVIVPKIAAALPHCTRTDTCEWDNCMISLNVLVYGNSTHIYTMSLRNQEPLNPLPLMSQ